MRSQKRSKKSEVEKELLSEVPEAPSTSEGTGGKETADKSETSKLPESVQNSINDINTKSSKDTAVDATAADTTTTDTTAAATAKDTPEVVKESIAESGEAPEAAANEEAVFKKAAVEKELLSEVKPENSTGEPAQPPSPLLQMPLKGPRHVRYLLAQFQENTQRLKLPLLLRAV